MIMMMMVMMQTKMMMVMMAMMMMVIMVMVMRWKYAGFAKFENLGPSDLQINESECMKPWVQIGAGGSLDMVKQLITSAVRRLMLLSGGGPAQLDVSDTNEVFAKIPLAKGGVALVPLRSNFDYSVSR